jgi:hypothetical protein
MMCGIKLLFQMALVSLLGYILAVAALNIVPALILGLVKIFS